jgi:hypothetical protein
MDAIDARLAKVAERIAAERAAGIPARTPQPLPAHNPTRRGPRPDDQVERERKQRQWDAILEHQPELAQFLREARAKFGKLEVETLRLEAAPGANHGPDLLPFNAVRIEIDLRPGPKNNQSQGRKR